jgi:2-oxoglutarate dehydrogenase E1 component
MDKYSYIANAHGSYVDALYSDYKTNKESVDETWQQFFEGFDFAIAKYGEEGGTNTGGGSLSEKEIQVHYLIHAYRTRGHLRANTNPIRERKDRNPRLDIEEFGLSNADLESEFEAGKEIGIGRAKLKDILASLKKIYEGSIGFEYQYIRHRDRLEWFKEKIEKESLAFKPN